MFFRLLRTVRPLKPVQILNRLQRRIWKPHVPQHRLPCVKRDLVRKSFPVYFSSWDGSDEFTFLNVTRRIRSPQDWNNEDWPKLWLYNLHYFDCLRQEERITNQAEADLIDRWMDDNPPGNGNGWEPYPLSQRIVNWIKWHLSGYGVLSPEAIESLALQARYLRKQLEYHLLANHLLANAKALIFAGCFFQGAEAAEWFGKGWSIYQKQVPEQILPDGSHFERSVMYHSIILEDLLDVSVLLLDEAKKRWLTPFIEQMIGFLVRMTGPDGRITLFNDAAFGIAQEPSALFAYATRLGFSVPSLEEVMSYAQDKADYVRMRSGDLTLFADVGSIGPDYQPGHAHADTFSFELFDSNRRLVVDTGTSCYGRSMVRMNERGTAAHNTVRVDGRNSSEVWGGHRVGRRAKIVDRIQTAETLTASHDGYCPVLHTRSWSWLENGLCIHDRLEGPGKHSIEIFFHFHPNVEVRQTASDVLEVDRKWVLYCSKGNLTVADAHWSSEFGKREPCKAAVVQLTEVLPCEVVCRLERVR